MDPRSKMAAIAALCAVALLIVGTSLVLPWYYVKYRQSVNECVDIVFLHACYSYVSCHCSVHLPAYPACGLHLTFSSHAQPLVFVLFLSLGCAVVALCMYVGAGAASAALLAFAIDMDSMDPAHAPTWRRLSTAFALLCVLLSLAAALVTGASFAVTFLPNAFCHDNEDLCHHRDGPWSSVLGSYEEFGYQEQWGPWYGWILQTGCIPLSIGLLALGFWLSCGANEHDAGEEEEQYDEEGEEQYDEEGEEQYDEEGEEQYDEEGEEQGPEDGVAFAQGLEMEERAFAEEERHEEASLIPLLESARMAPDGGGE
eukprot:TRINITY_DN3449_c0_g1_i2.p1 TRINITY_DN3449_c0_g1~~TRINITY_DN3449_c0_g1_i2.p1  ORF type:complete len:313 (-),score=106.28 TRINITY_DN3449_c0_g1_i2:18-956(-)